MIFLRYALLIGGIMTLLDLLLIYGFLRTQIISLDWGEVFGYLIMILSMIGIYFGVKNYRDEYLEGNISFREAFRAGSIISLMASLVYAVYTYLLYALTDFTAFYYQYLVDKIKNSGKTTEMITEELQQLEELFQNPLMQNMYFQTLVIFVQVLVIGLIITTITAYSLKSSEKQNA